MQHPFDALAAEYASLLPAMRVTQGRESQLENRAHAILNLAEHHKNEWADVVGKTGVPKLWGIASFERESSCDYSRSPAQGDRWDRRSVNVPRGLGPYPNWGASAVAAYKIDHLDEVKVWPWVRGSYEGELFNGFGPRNHGRHTGYLWSWSNIYTGGKYVSDGVWNPSAFDEQCGMIPMMVAMLRLDPSLALADAFPEAGSSGVKAPVATPVGVGGGDNHSTSWIQTQLNQLGTSPPLVVDGSYGRATRRAVSAFQSQHHLTVDGLAGPQTIATIKGLA